MKKIASRRTMVARAGAIVAAVALGATLTAGVAFADDTTSADSSSSLLALQGGLVTDYVADAYTTESIDVPTAFDLRYYGATVGYDAVAKKSTFTGGTNYVTPVKSQSPFGTCWSFAATSSSETSMIFSLDKNDDGLLNGSVDYKIAANSATDSLAYKASNLSERHLAYFAFMHQDSDGLYPTQVGEGRYLLSGTEDVNSIYNYGGSVTLSKSVYASGSGPVPEAYAPYISNEGWYCVPMPYIDASNTIHYAQFTSLVAAQEYMRTTWTDDVLEVFNQKYKKKWTKLTVSPHVSNAGTWSLDASKQFGCVAELDNSNLIDVSQRGEYGEVNASARNLMKQELNSGHALTIAYMASVNRPGLSMDEGPYMNTSTWAQYTFEQTGANHAVCIVGYDDSYSKENFTHEILNADGTVNEELSNQTTPAGDGAWIIKNSWGSVDNENEAYLKNWGVDGSGYFYLSYYDKSLVRVESFDYDVSAEAQERDGYIAFQHDLGKSTSTLSRGSNTVVKMCNVFDGPEEGESNIAVRDLGCQTGVAGDTVTLEVYVMDDDADATTVISSGKPAATLTTTFDVAGFHRVHLGEDAVVVKPGQKFAVVETAQRPNNTYEFSVDYGLTRSYAELANPYLKLFLPKQNTLAEYSVNVVNEGESFLYTEGRGWTDWAVARKSVDAGNVQDEKAAMEKAAASVADDDPDRTAKLRVCEEFIDNIDSVASYDNFTIKAYADVVEEGIITQPSDVSSEAGKSVSLSVETVGDVASYQWQHSRNGKTWNNTKWTGCDTDTLTFKMLAALDGRQWRCVVTFADGTVEYSDVATTTLISSPAITVTPESAAVGEQVTVSIGAIEGATYQWQHSRNGKTWNNTKWTGYDTSALTFKMLAALDGRQWRCKVTLADGTVVYSQVATTKLA